MVRAAEKQPSRDRDRNEHHASRKGPLPPAAVFPRLAQKLYDELHGVSLIDPILNVKGSCSAAKAIARRAPAGVEKRSCGPRQRHAPDGAIAQIRGGTSTSCGRVLLPALVLRPNGSQLAIRPSLVSAQPGCRAAVVGPVRVGREVGGREPTCAVCPGGSLPVRDLVSSYVSALSQRIGNEPALATSRPVPAIARFVLAPVVLADLVAGDLWFASELAIGLFPFFNLILRGFRGPKPGGRDDGER